jgi:type II secretory pathway pseudopilin PulG
MQSRKGYTLVELLVFLAIATVATVAFIGILVVVVRLQVRQSSAGSVQGESTALLQQLQYYAQNSSLINIPINTPTSTLSLRMSSSTLDPTTVTNASGTVYLKLGNATATALTSNRVTVSNLSFVRHTNPPSHDTVSISFTMSYNTPTNTQQFFSQSFQTAVTQVSAATFDSNILPSSTATYSLGTSGNIWNSVNNVIYFNGSNVGTNAPQAALDVSGGNIFVDTIGNGIKLRDPSGNCWLVTPNSSGTLQTASVGCGAP